MDATQIALVKAHYQTIQPRLDEFCDIFYDNLFEVDPAIKDLFSNSSAARKDKMIKTLMGVTEAVDNSDDAVEKAEQFSIRHVDLGVKEHHYALVGIALLDALEEVSGADWSDELKEAWSNAYNRLSYMMIKKAYWEQRS